MKFRLSKNLFVSVLLLTGSEFLYAQNFTSSNLPIIFINTNNGIDPPDSGKVNATMGIIYNGDGIRNNTTDPWNNYNGKIGIEVRGSSSKMFDKKQYAVETRTAVNEDTSVSLMGFPPENDWILYAPYNDKTLLRDVIVYKLANEMGHYASRTKFCELVLNGNYAGVYVLLEKVKRDVNRVNIAKLTAADTAGDDLTGGYIFKLDKFDGENNSGWPSQYPPFPGAQQQITYQYHYPKPDEITVLQKNYIKVFMMAFENAMNSPYLNDTINGYNKYIDVNSFVDYFLINEFSKSVDAFRLSMFMYKDKDSNYKKMIIGPVWDYNISLGNCDYYNAGSPSGWHIEYMTTDSYFKDIDWFQPPFWWKKLYESPYFRNKVYARWQELKDNVFNTSRISSYIDSCVTNLTEARIRNFQRWPVLGTYVWPNNYVGQTYEEEITYLKNFIQNRFTFMNGNMIGTSAEEVDVIPGKFELYQNYPNPFNPFTAIRYDLPEESIVNITVYNALGEKTAVITNEVQQSGSHIVNFDASNYASGLYFYSIRAGKYSSVRKMMLLK